MRSTSIGARTTAYLRSGAAVALFLLFGCSAPATKVRDTLDIAMTSSLATLNPLLSTEEVQAAAETLVLDPLITTDDRGNNVPVLAAQVPTLENGGISKDGLSITYHLRHGVRWQDGVPFTSRDVQFSWQAIMNPASNITTRHGYDDVLRVATPDRYTAVFHLRRPFAPAVQTFFALSDSPYMIVPAHILEKYHDLNQVPFNSLPIGTGPYKIVRWIRGDRIEYVANERYFLGAPKIRHIVVHYVPDENTAVQQLRSHEIDWFVQPTPRVYPQLRSIPGIVTHLVPFNGYESIMFNTKRSPWNDVRLRQAVGLAVSKASIVSKVTFGTTVAATEDLPAFLWAFDPGAGTTRQDVREARRLLAAAGWPAAPSGISTKDGRRLTLGLAFDAASATDRNLGIYIASALRDIGIEVQLKSYTLSLLYAPAAGGGPLASGNFDAALSIWYAGSDPDDSTQLLCDQVPPRGWNWERYCEPAMDAAQAVALSHYDRPTRKHAYSRIERLLARDAPFVYLFWPRQIEPVDAHLQGFRPNGLIEDWNAYQWSLGPASS